MEKISTPESSNIRKFGYDEKRRILRVEFKKGVYEYSDVPYSVFEKMKEAKSKGRYVAAKVVGKYEWIEVNE